MRRHELTDEEWGLIEPLVRGGKEAKGRPPRDVREMINAMMWVLRTGAPWRDLPDRYGPWQSAYHYFNQWRKAGLFDRILEALQIRLDGQGRIDWDLWCVDGSSIRATKAAAGASKKAPATAPRSRRITRWVARAADSGASCTWLLTARACRWPSRSAPGRRTNRNGSNR